MQLVGDLLRGHTDTIILALLEKGDSYGYEINKMISNMTNNQFSLTEATLYTAFRRLEKGGFITSYWQDGLNQTKRKYYSLTEAGKEYLRINREIWINASQILNRLILNEKS